MTAPRPLPDVEQALYHEHFRGLAEGVLRVQGCVACGHWQWPPRDLCTGCGGGDFHWPALPARGRVYTFSVVHRAPHPGFQHRLPYAIVVAELEGGLRVLGNAFGDEVARIACDVPVTARFRRDADTGVTLLEWAPA